MTQPFQFKQFTIHQNRCAMKVGTDGVLLGAWASIEKNPLSVLDIGAGTGVISLMLAQRSQADRIDAIEIEDEAFEQCVDNFENAPWSDRLFCYHASLQEFVEEMEDHYDLIVSNPPFYSENYKTKSASRDVARFNDALPFEHLIACTSKLLSENGIFVVIIPKKEEDHFMELASKVKLFPNRKLNVKGSPNSETKRVLLEFSFSNTPVITDTLIIETTRHCYTPEYIALTKNFYLKMPD